MFDLHEVKWTAEKIENFFNGINVYQSNDTYFSKTHAKELAKYRNKWRRGGRILDYGCGPGFLIEELINDKGCEIYGLDTSTEAVRLVNEKYSQNCNFKKCISADGFPVNYSDDFFDFVFLIETIEHLDDDTLESVISEIHRILKPGGYVLITTPNEENLALSMIVCPDCGCVFHKVQHMRAWSASGLNAYMKSKFFATEIIKTTWLHPSWFGKLASKLRELLNKRQRPNLIYIGKKIGPI